VSKQLFWLQYLWAYIARSREFPTKFAVKAGLSGNRAYGDPFAATASTTKSFKTLAELAIMSGVDG
jgi:hypothetical protein